VGRQPWVVYKLLRTQDAVSSNLPFEAVFISLVLFGLLYSVMGFFYVFLIYKKVQKGPESVSRGAYE